MNITRRNVLKGIGIGAAASALPAIVMANPKQPIMRIVAGKGLTVNYTKDDIVIGVDGDHYRAIQTANTGEYPDNCDNWTLA